jgi:hypothetical protein
MQIFPLNCTIAGLGAHISACDTEPPGTVYAGCPLPDRSSSSVSIGECAAIGIGMGLGMLAVTVVLLTWGRWMLRRREAEKSSLREKLLSTELEG